MLFSVMLAAGLAAAEPASPPIFDRAVCSDAGKRAAFLKQYEDPEDIPALAAIKKTAEQNEKRMTARLDRLAERARWSAEQKADFAMKLLADPAFAKPMEEAATILERMMKRLESLMAEKDEARQCTIVADMLDDLPAISANAERQWAAIDARINAEATTLGLSLD